MLARVRLSLEGCSSYFIVGYRSGIILTGKLRKKSFFFDNEGTRLRQLHSPEANAEGNCCKLLHHSTVHRSSGAFSYCGTCHCVDAELRHKPHRVDMRRSHTGFQGWQIGSRE